MDKIENIISREIFDSRGQPTLQADVILSSGIQGTARVPSGASTGKKEACELRDSDPNRYHGKGVLKALKSVDTVIKPSLCGLSVLQQRDIDEIMIELDGTPTKSELGANAILAVSLACASAASNLLDIPLYQYLGGIQANRLPVPMLNIINGGQHAKNNLDIQEFMLVPHGFDSFKEAIRAGSEVYHTLKQILDKQNLSTGIGDEGGFAPDLPSNERAIELLLDAVEKAGYQPGKHISIALDCAASSFFRNNRYYLDGETEMDSQQLINYYHSLIKKFPIVSIEDPMDEEDESGWIEISRQLSKEIMLVGDDNFVTNLSIFKKGIEKNIANSILIKLNQIGTLTETMQTIHHAQCSNYRYIISHRSGETEDTFIADLSVAMQGGFIKTGALARSERLAKYNRLLEIEDELGSWARYL
jgi:enolase